MQTALYERSGGGERGVRECGRKGEEEGWRREVIHNSGDMNITNNFLLRLKHRGIDFIGAPISQVSSHTIFYVLI